MRGEEVNWSPGKVTKQISDVTFLVRVSGKIRFVHTDHLKFRYGPPHPENEVIESPNAGLLPRSSTGGDEDSTDDESVSSESSAAAPRQSSRATRPPDRLTYYKRGDPR